MKLKYNWYKIKTKYGRISYKINGLLDIKVFYKDKLVKSDDESAWRINICGHLLDECYENDIDAIIGAEKAIDKEIKIIKRKENEPL